MSNLEKLLAAKLLALKQIKNIISSEFVVEDSTDKIYFVINATVNGKDKDGNQKTKLYKNDITQYIKNHGSIESFFKALITSEMLLAGYLLVPIEGGFICTGGEEIYSLTNNQCTCPAYLNNNKEPCKHLLFKEGILEQRARINNWKLNNLN
jgi:hypothetical protein